MTILGFMTNYMLRVNLSIAVVDMLVVPTISNASTDYVDVHRFEWNIIQKNTLLGSFFWGYTLTDIIGGRLSEILGPKLIFGGGMLLASLVTILMPLACYLHFYVAVSSRIALGMFLGFTYPCIAPLAIKWIPPTDRSKFMANMMSQGLGVALSLPMCGLLISIYGWPSVFYVTGFLGLLWTGFWFYLIYDSPEKHPRISEEEKLDIQSKLFSVDSNNNDKPEKMPWVKILLSVPVWAIIIAHSCIAYCQFINITQLPTYMKDVLSFDVNKNGLLSSIPNLGQYLMAISAGYLGDKIRKANKLTTITTRKVFASISFFVPALITISLAVWGQNQILAIFALISSFSLIGVMSAGHLPNGMDISPNFCGTIMGLGTTLASIAGWLSTKTVAIITKEDRTFDSWKYVFWIMALVYIIGGLFFAIFASGDVQKWNSKKEASESFKMKQTENENI